MVPSHLHHLHLEGMVCHKCRFPGLLQTGLRSLQVRQAPR